MDATSATSSTTTSATDAALRRNTLDHEAFLTLFVKELQTQDPTNPADSKDFIAQLASFSNVEQSIKINAKLNELMTLSVLSQANDLIGRTITSADSKTSGVVDSLRATSNGAVAVLKDGNEVTLGEGVKVT
jgi:flagellar basal-body rod modification protein FlgD